MKNIFERDVIMWERYKVCMSERYWWNNKHNIAYCRNSSKIKY
jgi:hypothetical protein